MIGSWSDLWARQPIFRHRAERRSNLDLAGMLRSPHSDSQLKGSRPSRPTMQSQPFYQLSSGVIIPCLDPGQMR
jgi:hypothetical protein